MILSRKASSSTKRLSKIILKEKKVHTGGSMPSGDPWAWLRAMAVDGELKSVKIS
ncbi:hypothetical protein BDV98DRAFT_577210 [Pterulicium gracile]|uniref:Uncharacterized protein n=1 Tax=Pterulicium gracile TaxID=1884261 RepID=A0A5C3Q1F6_9AGAR|nr:hypothetical protein BDV98DRAFT_577210 [Pterula gracilis]